jgi:hypothetical protein
LFTTGDEAAVLVVANDIKFDGCLERGVWLSEALLSPKHLYSRREIQSGALNPEALPVIFDVPEFSDTTVRGRSRMDRALIARGLAECSIILGFIDNRRNQGIQ